MTPAAEAQSQQKLVHTTWQRLLRRRTVWRVAFVLSLLAGLGLFLVWLRPAARRALVSSLVANQLLIALLFGFSLIALSLLRSVGQRLVVPHVSTPFGPPLLGSLPDFLIRRFALNCIWDKLELA